MIKAVDKWFRLLKGIPLNEQKGNVEQLVQAFKAAYKKETGMEYSDEEWLRQSAERNPGRLARELERMGGAVGQTTAKPSGPGRDTVSHPAVEKTAVQKAMKTASRCNRRFIGYGSTNAEGVKAIQAVLQKSGHDVSKEVGEYGLQTLQAVLSFQKERDLGMDGCVGPKTAAALGLSTPKTKKSKAPRGVATGNMKEVIKQNNLKYFGNEEGHSSEEWRSSLDDPRKVNRRLNFIFGPIPYKGTTAGRRGAKLHPQWKKDNLTRVSTAAGTMTVNKNVAESLKAAIAESQAKYGLPLRHNGAFVVKGKKSGFSTHVWGGAVDFDPAYLNPFSKDGKLSPRDIHLARTSSRAKKYWDFKNPEGQTWKEYLDSKSIESYKVRVKTRGGTKTKTKYRGESAESLYVFVAGPPGENGIAEIFKKHGWTWGGQWRGSKDGMHFSIWG
mgnify:CR=1 FL=1